jgi:hypothetical protein
METPISSDEATAHWRELIVHLLNTLQQYHVILSFLLPNSLYMAVLTNCDSI